MSWNNALLLLICAVAIKPAAAQIACPSRLLDTGKWHALNNAALYDGPVDQMASLAPAHSGNMDRWNGDGIDPYLVCLYRGTHKTVTLHTKPVRNCAAGGKPFRAFCK